MVQDEIRRLGAANSNRKGKKGEAPLKSQRRESGGNTSVDSMMEDTPSNYNIAN